MPIQIGQRPDHGFDEPLGLLTRYFAVAAPKHTADEEVSLFPRLRESGDPAVAGAFAALEALERDHGEAEIHHTAVDELVRRWLVDDCLSEPDLDQLRERLVRLQALYRRHITIEDREVFPIAARMLDRTQIEQIGGEMAARRQLRLDPADPR